MQNVLAEHEMFERFGGGETSKQGQAVETSSCQTNNGWSVRQALRVVFHLAEFSAQNDTFCLSTPTLHQLVFKQKKMSLRAENSA